MPFVA